MPLFNFVVFIEANSRVEAEQKIIEFQRIVSEYKKYTMNDALGKVVTVCSKTIEVLDIIKKANRSKSFENFELFPTKKPDGKDNPNRDSTI